jgi:hypothetical protein
MKRKATINNPYHRHHSAPGGRKKVQERVGVSDTVRVNRFAEGTQTPTFKVKESEPAEERYEIDLSVPFAIVVAFLIALVSVQLSN